MTAPAADNKNRRRKIILAAVFVVPFAALFGVAALPTHRPIRNGRSTCASAGASTASSSPSPAPVRLSPECTTEPQGLAGLL